MTQLYEAALDRVQPAEGLTTTPQPFGDCKMMADTRIGTWRARMLLPDCIPGYAGDTE